MPSQYSTYRPGGRAAYNFNPLGYDEARAESEWESSRPGREWEKALMLLQQELSNQTRRTDQFFTASREDSQHDMNLEILSGRNEYDVALAELQNASILNQLGVNNAHETALVNLQNQGVLKQLGIQNAHDLDVLTRRLGWETGEREGGQEHDLDVLSQRLGWESGERAGGQDFSREMLDDNQSHDLERLKLELAHDSEQNRLSRRSSGGGGGYNPYIYSENAANRTFQAGEASKDRDLTREMREGELSASLGESAAGRTHSTNERTASQLWQGMQAGLARQGASRENALGRNFAAGEAGKDRDLTKELREGDRAHALTSQERGATDSLIGTGLLPYDGKDEFGDYFKADDARTLANLKAKRLPGWMTEDMNQASAERGRALRTSLGGRRGMGSGTIARALFEDADKRKDQASRGRTLEDYIREQKRVLESRAYNRALGRSNPSKRN